MSELTIFNGATLVLDLATMVIFIGLMMVTDTLRRRGRDDDKLFFYILVVGIILSIADIIGDLAEDKTFYGASYVQLFGKGLFYLTYIMEGMMWMQYTRTRFAAYSDNDENRPPKAYYYYPGLLTIALVIVNFTSGWMFSVDTDNVYHYGSIYILLHIVFFGYIIYGFVKMIRYRATDSNRRLMPFWVYFLPIVIGLIVTFLLGDISMAPTGIMLSVIFTHLGSMNEVSDVSLEEGVL